MHTDCSLGLRAGGEERETGEGERRMGNKEEGTRGGGGR